MSAEDLEKKFKELDADGSGFLEESEFAIVMKKNNPGMSDAQIKQAFKDADFDGDGKIDVRLIK